MEDSPQYDVFVRDGVPRLGAPPRDTEEVVQANSEYYWEFGPGRPDSAPMGLGPGNDLLRLIPREGRPGYSPTNHGVFRMHYGRTNDIEPVRLVGFYRLYLLKMKVEWTDRGRFVAGAPDGSTAEGRVTSWVDGQRPARRECIVRPAHVNAWSLWVEYEYDCSRTSRRSGSSWMEPRLPGSRSVSSSPWTDSSPVWMNGTVKGRGPECVARLRPVKMLSRTVCHGVLYPVGFSLNREPLDCGASGLALGLDGRPGLSHGRRRTWILLVRVRVGRPLEDGHLLGQPDQNVKSGELPGPHACTPGARVSTQSPPRPHRPNPGKSAADLWCLSLLHCQAS